MEVLAIVMNLSVEAVLDLKLRTNSVRNVTTDSRPFMCNQLTTRMHQRYWEFMSSDYGNNAHHQSILNDHLRILSPPKHTFLVDGSYRLNIH